MGIDQVGIDQVGIDRVGIDRVGTDRVGIVSIPKEKLKINKLLLIGLEMICSP